MIIILAIRLQLVHNYPSGGLYFLKCSVLGFAPIINGLIAIKIASGVKYFRVYNFSMSRFATNNNDNNDNNNEK